MKKAFISYKNSQIHYYIYGYGPHPVLFFHGYGEDGSTLTFLERNIERQLTIIAIDLPFHGKTSWKEREFLPIDLNNISTMILEHERLSNTEVALAGYSLGGRMALKLLERNNYSTRHILLLAPDGLKVNFWYWLATQTWVGNRLFAFTMKHPGWFFTFLSLLNRLRLVNASVFKFVNYYIENVGARQLLFDRWTSLRHITPDLAVVRELIRKNKSDIKLVYGTHDRIILPVVGERFQKELGNQCEIILWKSGHQLIHEKHASELTALFSGLSKPAS